MQMHPSGDAISAQAPVTIELLSPRAEDKPSLSSGCILKLYLDFSQPAHSPPGSATPEVWFQLPPGLCWRAARLLRMPLGRSSSFPVPSSPSLGGSRNWAEHLPVPDQPQPKANGPSHPAPGASTAVPLSLIWLLFIRQENGGVLSLSALRSGLCSLPCQHWERVRAHPAPETAPSSC